MRLRVLVLAPLFLSALSAPAFALTQPNGAQIPSPMGCANNAPTGLLAAMACACTAPGICNIGAPCPGGATACANGENGTCETTLWHSPNDNSCIPSNESGLDPTTQATTTPETFHPTCGQTFTVISRGTAEFQDIFGWYNATTNGQPPPTSDLHVMIQCGDAAGKSATLDVQTDPSYKGGDIGFFLLTPESHTSKGACATGTSCCPTVAGFASGTGYAYYSQRELNPDTSATAPYIHLLIMPGTIAPNRFYFAWEDTFDTTSADFTDLVTAVDGVECSGAGVPCTTAKLGACALGITVCSQGSSLSCNPLVQPQPETCNGLDDNCDGTVDNGATCPTPGDVCSNGQCVGFCSLENPCTGGLSCDSTTGMCVDPKCVGVTCNANQVCTGGQCETACNGVVCPYGQTCVNNACINLCAGVACPSGQACRDGVCFAGCASCGGITCDAPLSCDSTSGGCVDLSCSTPCPSGTYCSSGACVPTCSGAVCPGGAACTNGSCAAPPSVGGALDGGLTVPTGGYPSGTDDGGVGGVNGGNGDTSGAFAPHSGACGCSAPGVDPNGPEYAGAFFAALAIGGVITRRRRRAR
jgi:MYXO-CTERM domain-containing protein